MEGKLVCIRAYERSDIDSLMTWVNDEEVTRQLGSGPLTYPVSRGLEEQFLEKATTSALDPTSKIFAIEAIPQGQYIGGIDLQAINWLDRHAGIGIVIGDKAFRGRGYGTDAMRLIMRMGFEKMNLHRLWLRVYDFNAAGIRCYEKCGFKREGILRHDRFIDGKYHDTIVMAILEDEYREVAKTW
jgi:RimJ/RimL family protein N-acetyltransferase